MLCVQTSFLNHFWPFLNQYLNTFILNAPITSVLSKNFNKIDFHPFVNIMIFKYISNLKLCRESPAKKTNILRLDMSGRFAVNTVDNLIIVHHQASRVSISDSDY